MPNYIIALDCGTTSTRAILFREDGKVIAIGRAFRKPIYKNHHEVEFMAKDLLSDALKAIDECLDKAGGIEMSDVKAFGLTNQRETVITWDCETGEPYHNAIVWLDTRTSAYCAKLRDEGKADEVKERSGLFISPYFSASKIRWLQDNCSELRAGLAAGRAYVGTLDCYLVWALTGGKEYSTDVTNASRTLLMNNNNETLGWDDRLLEIFGIDKRFQLPTIKASSASFGDLALTRLEGTPIGAVIGDQHAALVGHNCLRRGEGKTTFGTGCFLIVNTGKERVISKRLLTTIAYQIEDEDPVYALEGAIGTCGTAFEYLHETGRLPGLADKPDTPDVKAIEPMARLAGGPAKLVIVPALTGLLAPHWCEDAELQIFGKQPGDSDGNFIYAMLEGIACQVVDVLEAAKEDMEAPIDHHKVDGGVSANNLLMQLQADLSGADVYRSENTETTAFGAALLAGLHAGVYNGTEDFIVSKASVFEPQMDEEVREGKMERWEKAIQRTIELADESRD